MSTSIQGHPLEVSVIGCSKLKDTEWFSRQDPYICIEYGSTNFRTRTCTDGGKNPTFQEKFIFSLIEGLRELKVMVWNSNTITFDDFIGSGKVQLQKVITHGYDDSSWPLQTKTGRHAGEVRLIMHYEDANKHATYSPSAPPYATSPPASQIPMYSSAPPTPYPPPGTAYPTPSPYPSYSPNLVSYPPPQYPPPQSSVYPPQPYPPHSIYPPPPQYYPPSGQYPGVYPPPPY